MLAHRKVGFFCVEVIGSLQRKKPASAGFLLSLT
jgi:hypothetical protein